MISHILYDTKPLNAVQVKKLHDNIAGLSLKLMESFGIGVSRKFDWQSLSDEQFELVL